MPAGSSGAVTSLVTYQFVPTVKSPFTHFVAAVPASRFWIVTLTPICPHDCFTTCATCETMVSPVGTTTFTENPFGTDEAAISCFAFAMSYGYGFTSARQ